MQHKHAYICACAQHDIAAMQELKKTEGMPLEMCQIDSQCRGIRGAKSSRLMSR